MKRLPIVGVMGSGQQSWEEYAAPLGEALAALPVHLLTGGGKGIMTSVTRAFVNAPQRQGLAIGCIPTELDISGIYCSKNGYPNPYVEISIVSPLGVFLGQDPDQMSRNHINVLSSHLIIALPGSKGTLNEVSLAQKFKKPTVLFGPPEAFTDFPRELERLEDLETVLLRVRTACGLQ